MRRFPIALPAALFTALAAIFAGMLCSQISITTSEVQVYATVFDRKGNYVDGLTEDRFDIRDGGGRQKITYFESGSQELSCAILIDTTGSMKDALPAVKNSISAMLDQMRDDDAVAIYGFTTTLYTQQAFTTDKVAARRATLRLRAGGGTALFDAIAEVASEIAPRKGKKAIVLLTDGDDNASSLKAGAAAQRALKTGVPIFAIGEGEAVRDHTLMKQLETLASQTGGVSYQARSSRDVARVFADVQGALKHVYLLSYTPPKASDAAWRPIEISIAGLAGATVRGKQGYFPIATE